MPLFRKDPFGRAWVLISPERGLVPSDFGSVLPLPERSPLSPGNERETGPEIYAVRPDASAASGPGWRMRVIAHPAALVDSRNFREEGDHLFRQAVSSGYQEIIVEHPDARMTLDGMPRSHLVDVLRLYRERLALLAGKPAIRHVQISRNVGRAAGALFEHPHAQLLAVPVGSRWVEEEIEAADRYGTEHGGCLFCDVLRRELAGRERIVSHNEAYVAIAPYAAKTPFETWILPRAHASAYTAVAANTLPLLADILQTVVRALNDALDHPPYNMLVHTLPAENDAHFHWHIELLPRLTQQAGFDWGSGFYVNPTPPEDAARFLREALALQEVRP
ncbi:MAG: galactose-1-phosphate uridylyltransferase [Deinococcales bacterium]